MAKVVSLSDKVIRELDRIKEEEGILVIQRLSIN